MQKASKIIYSFEIGHLAMQVGDNQQMLLKTDRRGDIIIIGNIRSKSE